MSQHTIKTEACDATEMQSHVFQTQGDMVIWYKPRMKWFLIDMIDLEFHDDFSLEIKGKSFYSYLNHDSSQSQYLSK